MDPEPYGPHVIEIGGPAMLLTTTGGGVAVHLATPAEATVAGHEAVPSFYFDEDADDARGLAGYDRHALTEPRWSETTTCRRCLTLLDRHFPTPAPDERLALVAQLAADVVVRTDVGSSRFTTFPATNKTPLRKAVRIAIRKRVDHPVRTHSINGVYVECQAMYDRYARPNDHEAADAIDAVLMGEPPPHCEREWIISWETWGVA